MQRLNVLHSIYLLYSKGRYLHQWQGIQQVIGLRKFVEILGSGLIDQIQNMTIAAIQVADMNVWEQHSKILSRRR